METIRIKVPSLTVATTCITVVAKWSAIYKANAKKTISWKYFCVPHKPQKVDTTPYLVQCSVCSFLNKDAETKQTMTSFNKPTTRAASTSDEDTTANNATTNQQPSTGRHSTRNTTTRATASVSVSTATLTLVQAIHATVAARLVYHEQHRNKGLQLLVPLLLLQLLLHQLLAVDN